MSASSVVNERRLPLLADRATRMQSELLLTLFVMGAILSLFWKHRKI